MGHANLRNISEFFVKRLYAKGKLSIADCVQGLVKAGETVHASEGAYEDEETLGMACEEVVNYLLEYYENSGKRGRKSSPVIEPVDMTIEQEKCFNNWQNPVNDYDEDYYEVLDTISFKFCKGWRLRYKEVEPLTNVTN